MTAHEGRTPLMAACAAGDMDAVRAHLEEFRGRQNAQERGKTALMYAAERGLAEAVALLLPHEARMATEDGQTALMHAAAEGQLACARQLLLDELGMATAGGETALMYAAYYGFAELCDLLAGEARAQAADGAFALQYAIEQNHPGAVRVLLPFESMLTARGVAPGGGEAPLGARELAERWEGAAADEAARARNAEVRECIAEHFRRYE